MSNGKILVPGSNCGCTGDRRWRRQHDRASDASAITGSLNATCRAMPPRSQSGGLAAWQVKRVTLYIDAHLAERIICRELADLVKLSTRHFMRGFVVSFGRGPHNYLLRRRMEHAKLLMRTTSLALSHIAMECGMADQAHFCRTFLRIVGDRPSVWRATHRESTRSPCGATPTPSGVTGSRHPQPAIIP
jgi:AraC family transcriptional regulator